jgi:hypothetical protein
VLRDYVELIRPPNVATAVADVLAGFGVAGLTNVPALPWLLASTACLYAGGIVLNDFFDRHLDAVERPERPLPSGRVTPQGAATFGGGLLTTGVVAASMASAVAGAVAAAIAVAIVLYDAVTKRHAIVGPLNMGLCRGLNLVLGMAVVPSAVLEHWSLAGISVVYVAGVTVMSWGEVSGSRQSTTYVALGLLGASLGAIAGVAAWRGPHHLAGLTFAALLGWRTLPAYWAACRQLSPGVIRSAVGRGVLSLVLLDAAIAATWAGFGYSVVLVAAGLISGWLARWFAVT